MAEGRLRAILQSHRCFLEFCSAKEAVLGFVEHLFPPHHPLRIATVCALAGDPLSAFRLMADNACCCLCDALGDAEFAEKCEGRASTEFFYGSSLKALVAGENVARPSHGLHSQWLTLEEWSSIVELAHVAQAFMKSVRLLTTPLPRVLGKLDACEARFTSSWRETLQTLRGVRVDTRQLLMVDMALRRRLPGEVSQIVLRLLVKFPIAVDDPPQVRKRRRLV